MDGVSLSLAQHYPCHFSTCPSRPITSPKSSNAWTMSEIGIITILSPRPHAVHADVSVKNARGSRARKACSWRSRGRRHDGGERGERSGPCATSICSSSYSVWCRR